MTVISIVIPAFNEMESIADVLEEINSCLIGVEFEVIVVDDGSTDKTSEIVQSFDKVILISHRRKYGQTAALRTGIEAASGEFVVTLDADGQNDPHDILNLFEEIRRTNYDLINGWRKKRSDKLTKRVTSLGARKLRELFIKDGIHDSGCTLRIMRRDALNEIDLYGDLHRFIPALFMIRGFRTSEMTVNHRPRIGGTTKYNWRRIPRSLSDLIAIWFWSKYESRPLHLFGAVGMILLVVSLFITVGAIAFWNLGIHLPKLLLITLVSIFSLSGIQLIVAGLLADRLSRIHAIPVGTKKRG